MTYDNRKLAASFHTKITGDEIQWKALESLPTLATFDIVYPYPVTQQIGAFVETAPPD